MARAWLAGLLGSTLVACSGESALNAGPELVCTPSTASDHPALDVRVDHITVVVNDLAVAREGLRDLGFRLKDGTRHANGIVNVHAKTPAGSIELLTVAPDAPHDDVALEYLALLADGEGGAFLALGGVPVDSVAPRMDAAGVEYAIQRGPAWDYLTFPLGSPLRHVYFIDMHAPPIDADSVLTHMNGASRISAVALDGGEDLARALESVGAERCVWEGAESSGAEPSPEAGVILRLGGSLLSLEAAPTDARGRVRSLQFDVLTLGRPPTELHGIRIGWSTP